MYRAILPDGDITGASYEEREQGIELYTADEAFIAFVPYTNLVALVNEEVDRGAGRSVM